MEEKKVALTDWLVKAVVWTHNTNVNKPDYTPLQLVTEKSCNLLGLIMCNETRENVLETKAVK